MASDLVVICPKCEFWNEPLEAWSAEDSTFYEVYNCLQCGHEFKDDECKRARTDGKVDVTFYCSQYGGIIGWKKLSEAQITQMSRGDKVMLEGVGYMFQIHSFAINFPHPEGRIDLDIVLNPPPKPKFQITLERMR